jgi:hypothetical protein
LASFVGLILAWGCLEIPVALGLVDYRILLGTLSDEPWRHPVNRLDPDLLHVHKPHQRWQGTMTGDIAFYLNIKHTQMHAYDVVTDRDGFRNSSDRTQADIVVLGDSFVEGILVPEAETLPQQLALLTGQSVRNLGQIWYGPPQQEVAFKRFGLPCRPKTVVWCFLEGNDLKDLRRYEEARAQWDKLAPTFHSFKARSLSRNLLVKSLGLEGSRRDRPDGERNIGLLPSGQAMYFFYQGQSLTDDDRAALPRLEAILRRVAGTCEEQGIPFILAFVPIKYRVYRDRCRFPETSICRDWQITDFPEEIEALLRRASTTARFVNLVDGLRRSADQGQETYFTDDTHWTAAGHHAAARAIAQLINEPADRSPTAASP